MEMLQIHTRDLELTDRLRDYVENKVLKFQRYLPKLDSIRVDLSESNARDTSRRMVAQITIYVPKAILRAEERAGDIFAAVDLVLDKMYRRVERYKGRREARRRAGAAEVAAAIQQMPASIYEDEEESLGQIVREKEFEVTSILSEDAIEQMELLGHHFFIYIDAADGRLSVIYRRQDGDYGVLKPIF
jgi:putative sigma-54 modulation protein